MRGLLGFVSFVLLTQGAGGLAYSLTDGWFHWWALVHRVGFLDGDEVLVSVTLLVLGLAVGAASDAVRRQDS